MKVTVYLTEKEVDEILAERDKIMKVLPETCMQSKMELKKVLSYNILSAKVESIIKSNKLHVEDEIGTILL